MEQCEAIKSSGERCQSAYNLSPEGLCFWHDPNRRAEAQAARRNGGRKSGGHNRTPDQPVAPSDAPAPPKTFEDAALLIAWTIHAVATGGIDPKRAARISSLTNVFLRATEKANQQGEIEELREKIAEFSR